MVVVGAWHVGVVHVVQVLCLAQLTTHHHNHRVTKLLFSIVPQIALLY